MGRYGADVYWLETAFPPPEGRPLEGVVTADVAIVGGGYTGLWTALALREAEPSMRIAVLEAEEIGFGASGRNGGFATAMLGFSLAHLVRHYGADGARAAHLAVASAIDAMERFVDLHQIDCDWERRPFLMVATNPGQETRLEADLEGARELRLTDIRHVDGAELRNRIASPMFRRAWEEPGALLHPAKLVRRMARVAVAQGIDLYQGSPVRGWSNGGTSALKVLTATGGVEVDQVVIAAEAWARYLRPLRQKLRPLYSYILLTEPLSEEQWATIGWEGREGVADKRTYLHYFRPTADGRILWGGNDAPYHGGIDPRFDSNPRTFARLERSFARTFPQLERVRFTHCWGGPIGVTATFMPFFGTLPDERVHYGMGYGGHGVAQSHLGGRILRDLVLGRSSDYTALPFVNSAQPRFPPEPLARVGVALSRSALLRQDRRLDRGKQGGVTDPLLLRLMRALG